MNFSAPLARFITGTYTVTRRGPATTGTDGRALPATSSTLSIRASVQALGGRALQRNSEGMRVTERRRIYSDTRLQVDAAPDVVAIDGASWEVERLEDWNVLGGYFKYIVAKVGN